MYPKRRKPIAHKAGVICWNACQGQILLVRQVNGRYSIPKGKAKPWEHLRQTAIRELWEETGIYTQNLHGPTWGKNTKPGVRIYLYWTIVETATAKSQLPLAHDISKTVWVEPDEALRRLRNEQKTILKRWFTQQNRNLHK